MLGLDTNIRNLFLAALLLCTTCTGLRSGVEVIRVSEREYIALEQMFRLLFAESEAGHVLLGNKPMCVEGILQRTPSLYELNFPLVRRSQILSEGVEVWKRMGLPQRRYHLFDTRSEEWNHVLFVDQVKVRDVVQKNRALFQYVLGPAITPGWVVDRLSTSFDEATNRDKVLTGILLGFGCQNSLYGARLENLIEQDYARVEFPFRSHTGDQLTLIYSDEYRKPTSSPAFATLSEERSYLEDLLTVTDNLPIFYCLDTETRYPAHYARTRIKIQKLLDRPDFLEYVLKLMTGKSVVFVLEEDAAQNPSAHEIAENIINHIDESSTDYFDGLIEGFLEGGESTRDMPAFPPVADAIITARNNLAAADRFFADLDDSWLRKNPHRVFIQELAAGEEMRIHCRTASVAATIELHTVDGKFLWGGTGTYSLDELIPGLSLGMEGMRTGGRRRIAIPPELAYGCTSRFEPGITIIADVVLHDLGLGKRYCLEVDPLTIPDIVSHAGTEAELMRSVGIADGRIARTHFDQPGISVDEIAERISDIHHLVEN